MSKVQSVVFFQRHGWSPITAKMWLHANGFKPIKPVDRHLKGELRFRMKDPKQFNHFITKKLHHGIELVIGFKTAKK